MEAAYTWIDSLDGMNTNFLICLSVYVAVQAHFPTFYLLAGEMGTFIKEGGIVVASCAFFSTRCVSPYLGQNTSFKLFQNPRSYKFSTSASLHTRSQCPVPITPGPGGSPSSVCTTTCSDSTGQCVQAGSMRVSFCRSVSRVRLNAKPLVISACQSDHFILSLVVVPAHIKYK